MVVTRVDGVSLSCIIALGLLYLCSRYMKVSEFQSGKKR